MMTWHERRGRAAALRLAVARGADRSRRALATSRGAACRATPPNRSPSRGGPSSSTNLTADEWQNVEVWLNDHYRVTKSRMPPGERFGIPFSAFVAGFGQRFDAARQPIRGVEVTRRRRRAAGPSSSCGARGGRR
ncbi:MAG: hypothetical protein M0C28_16490 [Candidatus Moduliflexus flocculans]|nr:hypothetical protein [Candidatus Moduliflexus flocculans]